MQICFLKFIARRIKDDSLKQKKKEFPIAHNVTIVHLILCIILTAQRTWRQVRKNGRNQKENAVS